MKRQLLVRKIKTFFINPKTLIIKILKLGLAKKIPDKMYLKIFYWAYRGERLDIENPKNYSEKIQWLKIYDRNDEYTKLVDKYEVKNIIKSKIDSRYIIPTLNVWDNVEDINFKDLPDQFVLKCTHDSGGIVICENKAQLDIKAAIKKLKKHLSNNFYYYGREWPYKNIKPRIIAEKYMGKNLIDYKFFCFGGKVKTILVCSNRNETSKNTDFYDLNWNPMPFTRTSYTNNPKGIEKPKKLEEMISIAEKLSRNIPFVRVDLYEINSKVFFGELTFYPSSGFEGFSPNEYDKILGDWLELPNVKKEEE